MFFSVLFCPMTVLLDSIWLVQLCGSILFYSTVFNSIWLCMVLFCLMTVLLDSIWLVQFYVALFYFILVYFLLYSTLLYSTVFQSIWLFFCSVLSCDCVLLDFIQACSILHLCSILLVL